MESVSTRLKDKTCRLIRETAEEREVSQAEILRELIEKGMDYDDLKRELNHESARLEREYEERIGRLEAEFQEEISELERENERLKNEKRLILEEREENTELVREVKYERTLAERKARAGLLTKTKWALFGMGDEEE